MRVKNAVIYALLSAVALFLILLLYPSTSTILPAERPNLIDFLHPLYSIPSVLLVITAYLLKRRGRERFRAHYVAGSLGVSLTVIAALIGLDVVSMYPGHGANHFVFTLPFHALVAVFVVSIVLLQGSMGMGMLLFGRTRRRVSIHRRLSKWVVVVYLIQGALGLTILISLLIQL